MIRCEVILHSNDPVLIEECQNLCHQIGYNLTVTSALVNFLLRLAENGFGLALFDCKMQGRSAINWTRLMRRIRPKVQVVVFTKPIGREFEAELHEMGVFYLDQHPVAPHMIREVITAALNYYRNNITY